MKTPNDIEPKTDIENTESEAGAGCPASPCSASRFRQELETLINCNNQEAGSDTPDFILADYLTDCLAAFDKAVTHRTYWYGHKTQPVPSLIFLSRTLGVWRGN
jgi:hypothetical protein